MKEQEKELSVTDYEWSSFLALKEKNFISQSSLDLFKKRMENCLKNWGDNDDSNFSYWEIVLDTPGTYKCFISSSDQEGFPFWFMQLAEENVDLDFMSSANLFETGSLKMSSNVLFLQKKEKIARLLEAKTDFLNALKTADPSTLEEASTAENSPLDFKHCKTLMNEMSLVDFAVVLLDSAYLNNSRCLLELMILAFGSVPVILCIDSTSIEKLKDSSLNPIMVSLLKDIISSNLTEVVRLDWKDTETTAEAVSYSLLAVLIGLEE